MSSFLNAMVDFGKLESIITFVKEFMNLVVVGMT